MTWLPTLFGLFSPDRAVALTGSSLWVAGGDDGPVETPAFAAGVIDEAGEFETRYLGREAMELKGRTPERLTMKPLLAEGWTHAFGILEQLTTNALRESGLSSWAVPRILVTGRPPPGSGAARSRRDLLRRCGARSVYDIPYITACALGLHLDLAEPKVQGVLALERDWFACGVLAAHGILSTEDGSVGVDHLALDASLHLGEATDDPDALRRRLLHFGLYPASDVAGSAPWGVEPRRGEPDAVALTLGARPTLARIADGVRRCCMRLDPAALDELGSNGMQLCGEGALISGLAEILSRRTGLRVSAHAPDVHPAAEGLVPILENIDRLGPAAAND